MAERSFPALDTHELAWAAGFFDGEGNIRAKRNTQHPRIYYNAAIFMPQIDRQVLDRFRTAVAGIGKVSGPYDRSRYGGDRKPQWYYEVYSFERAQAVVAMLWNWLSPVKREQAAAVFMTVRRDRESRPGPAPSVFCSGENCETLSLARGLCRLHYHRWWREQRRRRVSDTTNGISTTLPGAF